jgi:hypothetical protein
MSRMQGKGRAVKDHSQGPVGYEAPQLTVLGTVHALTLDQDKKWGGSDGFLFMGVPIMNASG